MAFYEIQAKLRKDMSLSIEDYWQMMEKLQEKTDVEISFKEGVPILTANSMDIIAQCERIIHTFIENKKKGTTPRVTTLEDNLKSHTPKEDDIKIRTELPTLKYKSHPAVDPHVGTQKEEDPSKMNNNLLKKNVHSHSTETTLATYAEKDQSVVKASNTDHAVNSEDEKASVAVGGAEADEKQVTSAADTMDTDEITVDYTSWTYANKTYQHKLDKFTSRYRVDLKANAIPDCDITSIAIIAKDGRSDVGAAKREISAVLEEIAFSCYIEYYRNVPKLSRRVRQEGIETVNYMFKSVLVLNDPADPNCIMFVGSEQKAKEARDEFKVLAGIDDQRKSRYRKTTATEKNIGRDFDHYENQRFVDEGSWADVDSMNNAELMPRHLQLSAENKHAPKSIMSGCAGDHLHVFQHNPTTNASNAQLDLQLENSQPDESKPPEVLSYTKHQTPNCKEKSYEGTSGTSKSPNRKDEHFDLAAEVLTNENIGLQVSQTHLNQEDILLGERNKDARQKISSSSESISDQETHPFEVGNDLSESKRATQDDRQCHENLIDFHTENILEMNELKLEETRNPAKLQETRNPEKLQETSGQDSLENLTSCYAQSQNSKQGNYRQLSLAQQLQLELEDEPGISQQLPQNSNKAADEVEQKSLPARLDETAHECDKMTPGSTSMTLTCEDEPRDT